MFTRLSKIREKRAAGENGFTLIELLVVVVILGILIAIAIPLYLNYRKGANDSAAKSDLRGAVSTLEQCNADNSTYPTADFLLSASGVAGTCTQTINVSSGTSMQYKVSGSGSGYMIVDTNSAGGGKNYCYNSTRGGSVATVAGATLAAAVTTGC